MVKLGVAMVNVSMGSPYCDAARDQASRVSAAPMATKRPEHPLVGVARHFRLTAEIQRAFPHLPIVGSGYSYLQEFLRTPGRQRQRRTLFVRRRWPGPRWRSPISSANSTARKLDRKRVCRTFSYCTALMRSKHNELGQFATGCPPSTRRFTDQSGSRRIQNN